jgi:type IX secretion system PorP/SprF family membrane protein
MMKSLAVILFLALTSCVTVSAQQKPHYSQYVQNLTVVNPAVTGMYQGIDLRMGLRNQWLGLKDAPKTGYLSIGSPISFAGDMSTYRSSDLGVTIPDTRDAAVDYIASAPHHAIGALFLSDKTGPLNRTTANITYAYHLAIGDKLNLAMGLGMGVTRLGLNNSQLVFDEIDDPVVGNSGEINRFTPDLNAGLFFYTGNFYLSASIQQILRNNVNFNGDFAVGKDVEHYFLTAGYCFWIDNDFNFTPSVMVKMVSPLPAAYDLNLKFAYRDLLWIGGGYRKNDSYFGNLGFSIQQTVRLGYSFDFTRSGLKTVSSGSHELVLSVLF